MLFGMLETGFLYFYWGNALMILIGGGLIFLGIARKMEPLLLIPIGFGIILVNLPLGGLMDYRYELKAERPTESPGFTRISRMSPCMGALTSTGMAFLLNRSGLWTARPLGRLFFSAPAYQAGQEVHPSEARFRGPIPAVRNKGAASLRIRRDPGRFP